MYTLDSRSKAVATPANKVADPTAKPRSPLGAVGYDAAQKMLAPGSEAATKAPPSTAARTLDAKAPPIPKAVTEASTVAPRADGDKLRPESGRSGEPRHPAMPAAEAKGAGARSLSPAKVLAGRPLPEADLGAVATATGALGTGGATAASSGAMAAVLRAMQELAAADGAGREQAMTEIKVRQEEARAVETVAAGLAPLMWAAVAMAAAFLSGIPIVGWVTIGALTAAAASLAVTIGCIAREPGKLGMALTTSGAELVGLAARVETGTLDGVFGRGQELVQTPDEVTAGASTVGARCDRLRTRKGELGVLSSDIGAAIGRYQQLGNEATLRGAVHDQRMVAANVQYQVQSQGGLAQVNAFAAGLAGGATIDTTSASSSLGAYGSAVGGTGSRVAQAFHGVRAFAAEAVKSLQSLADQVASAQAAIDKKLDELSGASSPATSATRKKPETEPSRKSLPLEPADGMAKGATRAIGHA